MTLDTRIYIHDRVDPLAVFIRCNQLIGAHEGIRFSRDGNSIGNEPAQGLPAWLIVYFGDPPLGEGQHEEYCDGNPCPRSCGIPRWVEVSFDTPYGYRDDAGKGCADLHAGYLAELGAWLGERGLRWSWLNEFTGDVHQGLDGLEALGRP